MVYWLKQPRFPYIVTIIVGLFGDVFVGDLLNIPDAGTVFAIATIGVFLLQAVNKKHDTDDDTE